MTSGIWKSPHSLLPYSWTERHLHLQGTACTSERPRFQLRSEAWQETELTPFYYCCIRGHYLHTINQQEVQSHLHITCKKILPARLKFLFCIIWSLSAGGRCEGKNWNSIQLLFPAPTPKKKGYWRDEMSIKTIIKKKKRKKLSLEFLKVISSAFSQRRNYLLLWATTKFTPNLIIKVGRTSNTHKRQSQQQYWKRGTAVASSSRAEVLSSTHSCAEISSL